MKKIYLISPVLLLTLLLTGCGDNNNVALGTMSNADSTSNSTSTNASYTPVQADAAQYFQSMKSIIEQYQSTRSTYSQFIKDFNAGHYSSDQVINEVGNIQLQLQDVKYKTLAIPIPDSMTIHNQLFMQAVTDFDNSSSAMEDAAIHSVTEDPKKYVDNANHFIQSSDKEFQQFLTDIKKDLSN